MINKEFHQINWYLNIVTTYKTTAEPIIYIYIYIKYNLFKIQIRIQYF